MKSKARSLRLYGILLFVAAGVIKLPLEEMVEHSREAAHLSSPAPDLTLRESVGQMSFAASLGGLRSLVASIYYLEAYGAFEDTEWGKVDSLMTLVTRMQPREALYWDDHSWQMAWNAASGYLRNNEIRAALRDKLYRDHVQRGIDIANQGLDFLPNNPKLLVRLGEIYNSSSASGRKPDPKLAGEYFLRAHANGAQDFYERVGAYELTKTSDRESLEKAYEILMRYFNRGFRLSSMLRDIPTLEQKLQIPENKRIPKNLKAD